LVAESGDREKSEPDTNIALSATETDSQPVVFSAGTATVTAIKEIKNGILLLPHGTSTFDESRLENLFSDIITTTTDSNGLPYVVKKNDQGVVIEKIPYVVIPVNPKETP
jgi:hypothetical protein